MSPRTEYENRLQARRQTADDLRRSDDLAVNLRSALFCLTLLVAWIVFGGWGVPWPFLAIPVALFICVVIYHESIKRRRRTVQRSIEHYQRCLDRLDGNWTGVGPDGAEFLESNHPYTGDLDIFGPGSLFQLLNLPVTPTGANTLVQWLMHTTDHSLASVEQVSARQTAVCSLGDQLDLREQLAIVGTTKQSQRDAQQLQRWLQCPGGLTARWIYIVGLVLGALGTLALSAFLISGTLAPLILIILVELGFLYPLRKSLLAIKQDSEHAVLELRRIVQVVAALESLDVDDPEIGRLRREFLGEGLPASQAIHKLERHVSQFENLRHNTFMAPLAFVTMIGLYFACAIDRWRLVYGTHVDRWFHSVGQLETLLAFSQFHFENPTYCFPKLTDDGPQFVAMQLSHPLLPASTAIANDVSLADDCRLLLVSGSNMSGKSTMLRSVGINTVLAWAGAPVCARELTLSRLRVAAAMRMQDSLQSGTSHFFAELKRIQLVVELARRTESGDTVLFLLDEILHGTNSHDRLVGARGVIDSLLKAGAIGLVTTHDLALSDMVSELSAPARNVHFRDEWRDGQMTFDYQMREGVVPKSNALSLMRLLGLEV